MKQRYQLGGERVVHNGSAFTCTVEDLIGADDPTLYDRACHALSALLGEDDDTANGSFI